MEPSSLTWRERIVAARARGGFTREDRDLAASWGTCAVSEQAIARTGHYQRLPSEGARSYHIETEWPDLYSPGHAFYWKAVAVDNFDEAERLLDQIEDEALRLKRERAG